MCFGTDTSKTATVRWYFTAPTAKPLGFPTPFCSRNWIDPDFYPDLGELDGAARPHHNGSIAVLPPGTSGPCGDLQVWRNGWPGPDPPSIPRMPWGVAACCGGFVYAPGSFVFDFIVAPVYQRLTVGLTTFEWIVTCMADPVPLIVDDSAGVASVVPCTHITFDFATHRVEQVSEGHARITARIPGVDPDTPPLPPAYVRLASLVPTAGRYPGTLLYFDVLTNAFVAQEGDIWIVGVNLAVGDTYRADYVGHANDRDVYLALNLEELPTVDTSNLPVMLWQKAACLVDGDQVREIDASLAHNHYFTQLTPADGDTFEQAFTCPTGLFYLRVDGQAAPDCGKIRWYLDGIAIDFQDWYASSPVAKVSEPVEVALTAGRHVLKGVIDGTTGGGYAYRLTTQWLSSCAGEGEHVTPYPYDETLLPCPGCPEGMSECWEITLAGLVTSDYPPSFLNGTWKLEPSPWLPGYGTYLPYCARLKLFHDTNGLMNGWIFVVYLEEPAPHWMVEITELNAGGSASGGASFTLPADAFACTGPNTLTLYGSTYAEAPGTVTITPTDCASDGGGGGGDGPCDVYGNDFESGLGRLRDQGDAGTVTVAGGKLQMHTVGTGPGVNQGYVVYDADDVKPSMSLATTLRVTGGSMPAPGLQLLTLGFVAETGVGFEYPAMFIELQSNDGGSVDVRIGLGTTLAGVTWTNDIAGVSGEMYCKVTYDHTTGLLSILMAANGTVFTPAPLDIGTGYTLTAADLAAVTYEDGGELLCTWDDFCLSELTP